MELCQGYIAQISLISEKKAVENKSFAGLDCILEYKLRMNSKRRGAKVIYENRFTKKITKATDNNCPNEFYIRGALKSPYQNRVVFLLARSSYGYEGMLNKYFVVGGHLAEGFN